MIFALSSLPNHILNKSRDPIKKMSHFIPFYVTTDNMVVVLAVAPLSSPFSENFGGTT